MTETARDPELIQLFRQDIKETELYVDRLREILHRETAEADPLKCKVVYSLFDEVDDVIEDASHDPVRDAALITEAQRIQHYEMGGRASLREIARALDVNEDARTHEEALVKKESANLRLALIAERVYLAARKPAYSNQTE
jgi:ferritin-like metal-binding protein YciE